MGIFDAFIKGTKSDSEVKAAEQRSYEKEREIVQREKRRKAVQAAGERGRAKARREAEEGTGSEAAAHKIGRGASKVAKGIMTIGRYGASLNWDYDTPLPEERSSAPHRGKKRQKGKKTETRRASQDPFQMPEFPF